MILFSSVQYTASGLEVSMMNYSITHVVQIVQCALYSVQSSSV